MHQNAKVRRAINTLEHPLWNPTKYLTSKYTDMGGATLYSNGLFVPRTEDINILNRLLYIAQAKRTNILYFNSMGHLVKELGYTHTYPNYNMVRLSLLRWKSTNIIFPLNEYRWAKGNVPTQIPVIAFFSYTTQSKSGKGKKFEVIMGATFYALNNSKYSIMLPINSMEELKPYTKRLYEILSKSFYDRDEWVCSSLKLQDKMMVQKGGYVFNSVIRKSVKELKHLIDLNVTLKKGNFTFKKMCSADDEDVLS